MLQWCHLSHGSGRSNLKRSNRLVLLIGVFLAVVAFVGIALLLNSPGGTSPTQTVAPVTLPTVIATKDIPLGTRVTADMVGTADKKVDTERNATAFGDVSQVIGQVARQPITTGAQVVAADFSTAS